MSYWIAGIDVHKRMLAVVVADVSVEDAYQFERRTVGTSPDQLRALAEWLVEHEVEEVVMESTAQYWRPVWESLERYWQPKRQQREGAGPMSGALHLAQAQSNHGPRGRKKDFPDAERLVKRLVAQELTLSFVPDAEQRPVTEPPGVSAGGGASEAVQLRLGSTGPQCPTNAAGAGGRGDQPPGPGGAGGSAPSGDAGAVVRRARRLHDAASGLPAAAHPDA